MKLPLILVFFLSLITTIVAAEKPNEAPSALDTDVLEKKRLFFTHAQRQRGAITARGSKVAKKPIGNTVSAATVSTAPTPGESTHFVYYNGVLRSERGIQLMINGALWRPGLSGVIRARIRQNTNLLEIELDSGKIHRLQPGQSIELRP